MTGRIDGLAHVIWQPDVLINARSASALRNLAREIDRVGGGPLSPADLRAIADNVIREDYGTKSWLPDKDTAAHHVLTDVFDTHGIPLGSVAVCLVCHHTTGVHDQHGCDLCGCLRPS